jgi:hypothetical protein
MLKTALFAAVLLFAAGSVDAKGSRSKSGGSDDGGGDSEPACGPYEIGTLAWIGSVAGTTVSVPTISSSSCSIWDSSVCGPHTTEEVDEGIKCSCTVKDADKMSAFTGSLKFEFSDPGDCVATCDVSFSGAPSEIKVTIDTVDSCVSENAATAIANGTVWSITADGPATAPSFLLVSALLSLFAFLR